MQFNISNINKWLFLLFLLLLSLLKTIRNRKNPDFYWYLEDGAYVVQHHKVPTKNIYTFLPSDKWVAHSIGFYVILYESYKHLGDKKIYILTAFLLLLLYSITLILLIQNNPKILTLLILFTGTYFLLYWGTTLRPQLLTYSFLGLLLILYDKNKLIYTIFLIPLWSFFHAGVISGIALIALFAGNAILKKDYHCALKISIYLLVSVILLVAINPYHLEYFKWILNAFTKNMSLWSHYITEWSSVFALIKEYHQTYYIISTIILVLFLLLFFLSKKKKDPLHLVLILYMFYSALMHVRNIPIFAIISAWILPKYMDEVSLTKSFSLRLNDMSSTKTTLLLVVLTLYVAFKFVKTDKLFYTPEDFFPVKAVEYLEKNEKGGNILVPSDRGGFVEYHLYPWFRVSTDGRLSFPKGTLAEINLLWAGKIDPKAYINKYKVNYILLPRTFTALMLKLKSCKNVHLIYHDKHFLLYKVEKEKSSKEQNT